MKLSLFICLTCIATSISAQHVIVLKERNVDYQEQKNAYRLFHGEIVNRVGGGKSYLPDSTFIIVGYTGEMAPVSKFKVLAIEQKNKVVQSQSVFLEDGNLHEGYLFDLSFLRDSLDENSEIIIANYRNAELKLRKGGVGAQSKYPYDSSGLIYFYTSIDKFSDRYIRIIIPGYVTVFIDRDSIQPSENTYDQTVFEKYEVKSDDKKRTILLNNQEGHAYIVNPDTFERTGRLLEGDYPIDNIHQISVKSGRASITAIPEIKWYESVWVKVGLGFLGLTGLIVGGWFFGRKNKSREPEKQSKDDWGGSTSNERKSITAEVQKQPDTSSDFKEIRNQLSRIVDNQNQTIRELDRILKKVESTDTAEIKQLQVDNNRLSNQLKELTSAKVAADEKVQTLARENQRYQGSILFLDNYTQVTNKLFPLLDWIDKLEKLILKNLNDANSFEENSFASLVHTKYLKNHSPDKFNYWFSIIKTLKTGNGIIADKILIDKLSGKDSDEEKVKAINWLATNDCLVEKFGALLILMEELTNVGKITKLSVSGFYGELGNRKSELLTTMRQGFDIEADDIKLFSNLNSYTNIRTDHSDKMTYNIEHSADLAMGDILEIKTYGLRLKNKTIETVVFAK